MFNTPWSHGHHLVCDFTCTDTLAPLHLHGKRVSVAKRAEQGKTSKNQTIALYHKFIPTAVETLGPMGLRPSLFFRTGLKTETADRGTKIHTISFPMNLRVLSEGKYSCNQFLVGRNGISCNFTFVLLLL